MPCRTSGVYTYRAELRPALIHSLTHIHLHSDYSEFSNSLQSVLLYTFIAILFSQLFAATLSQLVSYIQSSERNNFPTLESSYYNKINNSFFIYFIISNFFSIF